MHQCLIPLVSCVALLLASTGLSQTPISITNPSFESQFLQDGEFRDNQITGWDVNGFFAGVQNWTDTQYAGATEGGAPSIVPNGRNSAFLRVPDISFSQTLSSTLQANTDYSLNYFIGRRADGLFPSYRAELLAGNRVLAVDNTGVRPDAGSWLPSGATVSIGDFHPFLGESLEIRFTAFGATDPIGQPGVFQVNVDSVSLTSTPAVPEPNSAAMACLAIVGLGLRSRKARSHKGASNRPRAKRRSISQPQGERRLADDLHLSA